MHSKFLFCKVFLNCRKNSFIKKIKITNLHSLDYWYKKKLIILLIFFTFTNRILYKIKSVCIKVT